MTWTGYLFWAFVIAIFIGMVLTFEGVYIPPDEPDR